MGSGRGSATHASGTCSSSAPPCSEGSGATFSSTKAPLSRSSRSLAASTILARCSSQAERLEGICRGSAASASASRRAACAALPRPGNQLRRPFCAGSAPGVDGTSSAASTPATDSSEVAGASSNSRYSVIRLARGDRTGRPEAERLGVGSAGRRSPLCCASSWWSADAAPLSSPSWWSAGADTVVMVGRRRTVELAAVELAIVVVAGAAPLWCSPCGLGCRRVRGRRRHGGRRLDDGLRVGSRSGDSTRAVRAGNARGQHLLGCVDDRGGAAGTAHSGGQPALGHAADHRVGGHDRPLPHRQPPPREPRWHRIRARWAARSRWARRPLPALHSWPAPAAPCCSRRAAPPAGGSRP